MSSSLLNRSPDKGIENNNNSRQSLKAQVQTEILSLIDERPGSYPQDTSPLENIDQLSRRARRLLFDKKLELSKARSFFWSLVEAYVDRFQVYPFNVPKALFSYLELHEYPEAEMKTLVEQLELRYLEQYGRPMKKATELVTECDSLDSEIRELRDSLKYASLVDQL